MKSSAQENLGILFFFCDSPTLDYVLSRVFVTKTRFGLEMDLLTLIHTTRNIYKAIADLHKVFSVCFTSRFLVTDLNNGDSSASVVTPLPAR
jgi:hypothetical protein